MKKKVVSVLMAAAMVAGMAGCGSSNTGNAGTTNSNASTNNEATTESGDASASTATDSDVEKPEEITIMVDGTVFTQENGQAEFIAKLEDLLGMKINVIQPDHDAYYDVVGQTVASGDWPDVMILSSTYYAGYAEQGVLWDMTDAYASSDLKTRQDAYGSTGVIDGVRLDGKLYGMPAARGNGCVTYDGSSVLHVRVDLNHHKVKIFTIHRGVCPECAADVKENLAKLEIEKDYIFLSNF